MKKKKKFEDDGRTIANMDIDGMPKRMTFRRRKKGDVPDVTKKERRKIIQAYFAMYMPQLICMVLGLVLAILLLALWMR